MIFFACESNTWRGLCVMCISTVIQMALYYLRSFLVFAKLVRQLFM